MGTPPPSSSSGWFPTRRSPRAAWGSVVATAALLGLIEFLDRTILPIPVPISISQLAAVYAALVGGMRSGLISAAMIASYGLVKFSIPGQPFNYTYENLWRALVGIVVPTGVVLVIGFMRSRGERASLALREKAVLEAQLAERRKIEQELRRQRSEQQTIFHSVPAMIWFKDRQNRILRANYHAARSIGKTVEEVEGRTTEELYPQEAGKYLQDDLEVANTGKPKLGITERYEVAGGKDLWVRTDKVPYRDENGNVVGVIVFAVDVTEQYVAQRELQGARDQLEQRVAERTAELTKANEDLRKEIRERERAEEMRSSTEHSLQQIIDNSTAVIYGKDVEGRYWLLNKRWEEIFLLTRDECLGRTDAELFHPRDAEAFRANDQLVLRAGKPIEFEEVAPHHDGPHDYISLKFPLFDAAGQPIALCGISTDISDRKLRETQLREYANQLEQANRDLAAAREVAESANLAKSRFLANISHEIRTPIMAMLGAAELLGSADPAADRRNMILRNGRHLLALIDELLDVSRIEAGKLPIVLADCSILEVLADVDAVTEPLRRNQDVEYGVVFESPMPDVIRSDRTRLTQAIINLVNNALKFTDRGHVRVRVRIDRDAAEPRLAVVVEDTGIGIRADDRERIFETFTQADGATRSPSAGAGLGLPIARWIAERLGGGLTVEPNDGGGSRFILRVATGDLASATWTDQSSRPQAQAHLREEIALSRSLVGRVLLAEDADDTRELIRYALCRAGAEVVPAANGREAVELSLTQAFDLILLDIRMPELDGLAAAKDIRSRGFRGAMIALTASTSGRERERVLTAGFDDVWPKPISLSELIERTSDYLAAQTRSCEPRVPRTIRGQDHRSPAWDSAVAHFAASLPHRMRTLHDAWGQRDRARLHEVLHQLVGAAGIHGFMELSHEAARLMAELKTAAAAERGPDLGKLQTLVDRAVSTSGSTTERP